MSKQKWWQPRNPSQIEPTPWLHPKAITYLESLLTPDMEVLEFGAGGSTLWFAERVKHVVSFEHDNEWYRLIKTKAPESVHLISASPFGFPYNVSMSKRDLLFIDGEPVEQRKDWLEKAPQLVKPGGYVILDNANRPEYASERAEFAKHATLLHTVNGNEPPCVHLITEFYRLKGGE